MPGPIVKLTDNRLIPGRMRPGDVKAVQVGHQVRVVRMNHDAADFQDQWCRVVKVDADRLWVRWEGPPSQIVAFSKLLRESVSDTRHDLCYLGYGIR